jgi:hypothetical protein
VVPDAPNGNGLVIGTGWRRRVLERTLGRLKVGRRSRHLGWSVLARFLLSKVPRIPREIPWFPMRPMARVSLTPSPSRLVLWGLIRSRSVGLGSCGLDGLGVRETLAIGRIDKVVKSDAEAETDVSSSQVPAVEGAKDTQGDTVGLGVRETLAIGRIGNHGISLGILGTFDSRNLATGYIPSPSNPQLPRPTERLLISPHRTSRAGFIFVR